jgi:hypothetical protein
MAVALVGALIGLVCLALVVSAWRGARRAVIPLVILRALAAITAVPAFFADDVPGGAKGAAGVGIVITVLAIAFVMAGRRQAEGRIA